MLGRSTREALTEEGQMSATTAAAKAPRRRLAQASLVDRVTDELHRALLNGDIQPGSSLSIVELCTQFGVSHIPVREALRRLESEGLLVLRPGRSAMVMPLSAEDLSGSYRLRRLIEGDLAARAGREITDASLTVAAAALDDCVRTDVEPAALAGAHHAFHAAMLADVMGIADRRVLDVLWRSGDRYLHLLVTPDGAAPGMEPRVDEHRRLLELAQRRDGAGLARAWIAHLGSAEAALLSALEARSSAF